MTFHFHVLFVWIVHHHFVGEGRFLYGEVVLQRGFLSKKHGCLQSVLWSFVCGSRLQPASPATGEGEYLLRRSIRPLICRDKSAETKGFRALEFRHGRRVLRKAGIRPASLRSP